MFHLKPHQNKKTDPGIIEQASRFQQFG